MDAVARETLARLLNSCRIGALGTLRDGGPFVSMTPVALAEDSSMFLINVSRLAHHTQDMLKDSRVSLMLVEGDSGEGDPQTLARLTIRGEAAELAKDTPAFGQARTTYLAKFPGSEITFQLNDFGLWKIVPEVGRFVAGLGRTYTVTAEDLHRAAVPRV
jgi:putative heme iron utilization protein